MFAADTLTARLSSPARIRPSALPWLAALGLAAAYLVVFVAQLPHNIGDLGWVSDYVSGFTISETVTDTVTQAGFTHNYTVNIPGLIGSTAA